MPWQDRLVGPEPHSRKLRSNNMVIIHVLAKGTTVIPHTKLHTTAEASAHTFLQEIPFYTLLLFTTFPAVRQ